MFATSPFNRKENKRNHVTQTNFDLSQSPAELYSLTNIIHFNLKENLIKPKFHKLRD